MPSDKPKKLDKTLGLWDVYAISTGAMFSSGFFLLPGLATAEAGPSTLLAYLISGLLMIPPMLCMAELATALPRAGGTYYYLDRSMGPAVGTIGGLGSWLALVLKSGFALLGMGAYLAIMPGVSEWLPVSEEQRLWVIKGLAVALTVVFAVVNIFGAKESTRLQGILVIALLSVLAFFLVQGLWYVFFKLPEGEIARQYKPFLHQENGVSGIVTTIGLVFVSYAGLTKVASVSEEVKRPDRNLPLGMFLSLLTATTIYVIGVAIMIATVDRDKLQSDYTPVATSAARFFDWLPEPMGLILIVIAALAAFASTGNAGILAASRYPLAMSRDKLVSPKLGQIGRFGTPTVAIIATAAMMIFFILVLSAEGVAKLASSFNLLLFAMVGLAVIVMRQSRIQSYDPGFRCPFYPWLPLLSTVLSLALIAQLGLLSIMFSLGVIVVAGVWYMYYGRPRTVRHGAVFHWFAILGKSQHDELDQEFRQIMVEKGARAGDPFDDLVTRAIVIDADPGASYQRLLEQASEKLAARIPKSTEFLTEKFVESGRFGFAPLSHGVVLPHFRSADVQHAELVIIRTKEGVQAALTDAEREAAQGQEVHAVFMLVSPEEDPGVHLRILAHLAGRIENEDFMPAWLEAKDEQALKEILLRDERFVGIQITPDDGTGALVGQTLAEIRFPQGVLVAMIRRNESVFVPRSDTRLQASDRLTLIGEPDGIADVRKRFMTGSDRASKNKTTGKTDPATDTPDKTA